MEKKLEEKVEKILAGVKVFKRRGRYFIKTADGILVAGDSLAQAERRLFDVLCVEIVEAQDDGTKTND